MAHIEANNLSINGINLGMNFSYGIYIAYKELPIFTLPKMGSWNGS
jgi:hypothetical protein